MSIPETTDVHTHGEHTHDVQRIDVHTHFVPPEWRNVCEELGFGEPDGMPGIPVSVHDLRHSTCPNFLHAFIDVFRAGMVRADAPPNHG